MSNYHTGLYTCNFKKKRLTTDYIFFKKEKGEMEGERRKVGREGRGDM